MVGVVDGVLVVFWLILFFCVVCLVLRDWNLVDWNKILFCFWLEFVLVCFFCVLIYFFIDDIKGEFLFLFLLFNWFLNFKLFVVFLDFGEIVVVISDMGLFFFILGMIELEFDWINEK